MNEVSEEQPFHFGNFTYDIGGGSVQTFAVQVNIIANFTTFFFTLCTNSGLTFSGF